LSEQGLLFSVIYRSGKKKENVRVQLIMNKVKAMTSERISQRLGRLNVELLGERLSTTWTRTSTLVPLGSSDSGGWHKALLMTKETGLQARR